MAGNPGDLTRRQEAAIVALIAEPTVARAAENAGVALRTLERWLSVDSFVAAYRAAAARTFDAALADVAAATSQAARTLRQSLDAESESVRLTAARAILDSAAASRDRAENTMNRSEAESFVSELQEVLRRHIDDPQTLGAIGRDMLPVSRRYYGSNEQNGGTHAT